MKIHIALTCICILPLTSCNQGEQKKAIISIPDSGVNTAIIEPIKEEETKDYLNLGFELISKEKIGELRLDMPLQEVLKLLNEPDEKTKAELWGSDGEYHQKYTYLENGIELDIIGGKDSDKKTNSIAIGSPCVYKTLKKYWNWKQL